MSYFLYPKSIEINSIVSLEGEEAQHLILSRRAKIGEFVFIQDSESRRYEGKIIAVNKKNISININKEVNVPNESPIKTTVLQALVAEQSLDLVLQKSTELGANEIIIFCAEFSPSFQESHTTKKLARWKRICQEAAKQSDRAVVPQVSFYKDHISVLKVLPTDSTLIILDKTGACKIQEMKPNHSGNYVITVGPEGGLSNLELEEFKSQKNSLVVTLGSRILRAETAAIAGLTQIQSKFGDL